MEWNGIFLLGLTPSLLDGQTFDDKVKHDQYLIANVQVSEAAAPCSGPLQHYDVQFYLIIFPITARGGPGRLEKGTDIDVVAYDQSM